MAKILLVEDEHELNQMVCDYLTNAGHTVLQTYDGSAAVREAFQSPPDLIVLDLNLPGLTGIDVARTITDQTEIPIIIVSARGEEEDRLAGFSAGVDDYLVKPFSLPELTMRVTAVLRRTEQRHPSEDVSSGPIVVGDLKIDSDRREVTVAGRPADLTAAQFAILSIMAHHPGRVFTRLQLLESFQDHAFEGYERTVDVHIGKIRKQIEEKPSDPQRLVTVWGVGYRLEDR